MRRTGKEGGGVIYSKHGARRGWGKVLLYDFFVVLFDWFFLFNLEDYQTLICRVDNAPVCLLSSDGL